MFMHDGDWGPINGSSGHEWWFAHWPVLAAVLAPIVVLVVLWSLVWKGLALWHSGRRGDSWWFVILLVVNTLGILEIIYLFFVAKLHWRQLFSKHDHRR
jgi:hypothetical protein